MENLPVQKSDLALRIAEVKENLSTVDNFRIPKVKTTTQGFELIEGEKPELELTGILLHLRRQNVYYADAYKKGVKLRPTCFSVNGVTPDRSIPLPVHFECKGCPMNEYGTNQMGSGKACRNTKPIYMLLSDEAIIPRELTITPINLKALDTYLLNLTERGVNYRRVKTKVIGYTNSGETFLRLKFQMIEKLPDTRVLEVNEIKNSLLPVMDTQLSEDE